MIEFRLEFNTQKKYRKIRLTKLKIKQITKIMRDNSEFDLLNQKFFCTKLPFLNAVCIKEGAEAAATTSEMELPEMELRVVSL